MYMDIKVLVVGALQENCYVCSIGNNAFIVDPGDEADRIIDACMGKNVVEIIVTHHHFDHVGALDEIKKYFKLEENVKSGMFDYEIIETDIQVIVEVFILKMKKLCLLAISCFIVLLEELI